MSYNETSSSERGNYNVRISKRPHDYYVRVRLSKEEFDKLKDTAVEQNRTMSGVVRFALDLMYNKKES